jgi:hypothetical protein
MVQSLFNGLGGGGSGGGITPAAVLDKQVVTGVAATVLTTLNTITPTVETLITKVECSGQEYGKFQIYIDNILQVTKRGGPSRNVTFDFSWPLKLNAGQIFDVKVTHFVVGQTPDFESSIFGFTS